MVLPKLKLLCSNGVDQGTVMLSCWQLFICAVQMVGNVGYVLNFIDGYSSATTAASAAYGIIEHVNNLNRVKELHEDELCYASKESLIDTPEIT